MKHYLLGAASFVLLAACDPTSGSNGQTGDVSVDTAELSGDATLGEWGIETQHISEDVAPGDDFFTYVNEGWLEGSELPQGFSSLGAFTELYLEAEERVNGIIAEAAETGGDAGSAEQQIGALYSSYLNTDTIEALGLSPIQSEIDAVQAISDHTDVARMMARPGHISIVGLGVTIDPGNPDRYVLSTAQSGLGLPNKTYYQREDEPFPGHREAYVDYIAGTFERAGLDYTRADAEAILQLESAMADIHWDPEDRRDRIANYNLMSVEELNAFAPGFEWQVFLDEQDVGDQTEIIVNTDSAVQGLAELFAGTPVELLKAYMSFHIIDNTAGLLSSEWDEARFDFYSRRLSGVEEQRDRDRRAIQYVNGQLGEVIGQVYVDRYFPPEYRAEMEELVEYLREAFRERLGTLEWMDDETREEGLAKLEAFIPKIGYPDVWRDYSSVEITEDDLVGNARRLSAWGWQDSISRLGGPVRDWEWGMTPQTVNAYYSPQRNEIVFPAAILQAPFFDPYADAAVNFGGIGAVIGHEMGHGFDDQGSRSDGTGLQRNWWTDFARNEFEARTGRLVEQYSSFEPLEGVNLNGELGLGENIGDLGGLSIARHAYNLYLEDNGGDAPVLDGFTADQRFYMAWAQVWRNIRTDESLRRQVMTGPHSPAPYRVNGVVRNMDGWYEAFGVTEEHALYLPPEERVSIW